MLKATAVPEIVRELLTQEAGQDADSRASIEAVERICEKLRTHLSTRVGKDGFQTLLSRALILATIPYPHLSAVSIGPDGALEGLGQAFPRSRREPGSPPAIDEAADAAKALVASLLGLLITFIGEDLTLRILGAVWPNLYSEDTQDSLQDSLSDAPVQEEVIP